MCASPNHPMPLSRIDESANFRSLEVNKGPKLEIGKLTLNGGEWII